MNPTLRRLALATIAPLLFAPRLGAQQTRAERTKYTETSLYTDIISFLDSLQQRGAKIRVGFIGRTMQGRDVPYVIASRPLVTTPLEAKRLGRPRARVIDGNWAPGAASCQSTGFARPPRRASD